MDEIVPTLVVWLMGSAVTGLMLWLDRRWLDARARARGWNGVTTALALSGLFVPAPVTFGAHVWVTRVWPWWKRLPIALLGSVLALVLTVLSSELLLELLGALLG